MFVVNNGKTYLSVIENMSIDRTLPKFKIDSETEDNGMTPSSGFSIDGVGGVSNNLYAGSSELIIDKKTNIFARAYNYFNPKKVEVVEPVKMTIQEFFLNVKNSTDEIIEVTTRADSYKIALEQAKAFGQQALVEKLIKNIHVVKQETQLFVMDFKTIIREGQIVDFVKAVEKGIKISYIKNYTRIIPEKLLAIKKEMDEKEIFDNYVIMHYDPYNEDEQMTEKEIEKAKDPILFGLIAGSRKLYYIGDWIDEHCDLTLETIIETLGNDAVSANNLSLNIKTNI